MTKHGMPMVALAMTLGFIRCEAAWADDAAAPAKPAAPSVSDVLTASGLTESGYVSASYYHSNGYNTDHQFDDKHDSFQLDQAALTVAYQPKEGFGALVDVAAGEDMKILNAAEGSNPNTFDIVQGFVQYAKGPLTVIGGKFVTLAGAEVIAPTGNTNFSRSFLFYAEPLTHTGISRHLCRQRHVQRHCGCQQWLELLLAADVRLEDRRVRHCVDSEQGVLAHDPGVCRQG